MKGVIMAGGFGTRLRPVTSSIPKPMVPVVNVPIMEHLVRLLKVHKFSNLISILFFQPEFIKNYFADGKKFNVTMQYIEAKEDYGTAGSVKNSQALIGRDNFLVISGDLLTNFNLSEAVKFHKQKKSKFTIVLTRVKNPIQYGIVITNKRKRIIKFLEKPSWGEVFSDTINSGIYIIENEILDYIPEKTEFDFSKDLFPLLMKKGIPIYGYVLQGYWRDIGNITEYKMTHKNILSGELEIYVHGKGMKRFANEVITGKSCKIAKEVTFKNSVLMGNGCEIGERVEIVGSVIGDNCKIGNNVCIKNSVLWNDVQIGAFSRIHEDIICSSVKIGKNSYVLENSVISNNCNIGDNVTIRQGIKIWPGKEVESGSTVDKSIVWADKWVSKLFGAYGITGIANIELTPQFSAQLGATYGALIGKGKTILIGHDIHRASRMIARSFATGVLSVGVNVKDLSTTPVPVMRYNIAKLKEIGGVYIRKSPFDLELIDIKFYDTGGLDISTKYERSIERIFFREDYIRPNHKDIGIILYPYRILENYEEGFLNFIDRDIFIKNKFKVVLDYTFSSSTRIFSHILGKLGIETVSLNAILDEEKITRSTYEFYNDLSQLSDIVKALKFDLGIKIDSGAEKIFAIDNKGKFINDDELLNLYVYLISKIDKAKKILIPISASSSIDLIARKFKTETVRSKFNVRFMSTSAVENKVDFVGETKGGFMFPKFMPIFDGMISSIKLIELILRYNKCVSTIRKEIKFNRYMKHEHIFCPIDKKGKVIRQLIESEQGKKIQLIDGIKIFLSKTAWVFIIPDIDRSLFHVNAESNSRKKTSELIRQYIAKIKAYRDVS